jgi:hypothetical protein
MTQRTRNKNLAILEQGIVSRYKAEHKPRFWLGATDLSKTYTMNIPNGSKESFQNAHNLAANDESFTERSCFELSHKDKRSLGVGEASVNGC